MLQQVDTGNRVSCHLSQDALRNGPRNWLYDPRASSPNGQGNDRRERMRANDPTTQRLVVVAAPWKETPTRR